MRQRLYEHDFRTAPSSYGGQAFWSRIRRALTYVPAYKILLLVFCLLASANAGVNSLAADPHTGENKSQAEHPSQTHGLEAMPLTMADPIRGGTDWETRQSQIDKTKPAITGEGVASATPATPTGLAAPTITAAPAVAASVTKGKTTALAPSGTAAKVVKLDKPVAVATAAAGKAANAQDAYVIDLQPGEMDMLAKIIYAEARGEDYEGQIAVAAVVINRVQASGFPKTVSEVIHAKGAFTAIRDGQYRLKPDKQAYKAAQEALRGKDPTGNAVYYYNPKIATSKWIRTRTLTTRIGNHWFAR